MKKIYCLLALLLLLVSCKEKTMDVKIMTFNVRLDVASDSMNAWGYRKDVAAQIIKDQNVDIVGGQEVLYSQLEDLKTRLPEYQSIGVGRQDGSTKGEFSPILYKKDRFETEEFGNFWLSETPGVAGSKGWDAACERIATWAILRDRESGKQFFVINTHFDHIGQEARRNSVELFLSRAFKYSNGLPIIALGDFNATPDSEVIQKMTNQDNPEHLIHSKEIAKSKSGTDWTFHDFGRKEMDARTFIDYIFVSKGVVVKKHETMPEKMGDTFISDHLAVVAHVSIP